MVNLRLQTSISLSWREGSQPMLRRNFPNVPAPRISPHISENLVLNYFTCVWPFGHLSMEPQLPPEMKGNQDMGWPACPMLSPMRGHPSQAPKPCALRQILWITNATRLVFVESLSTVLVHVCYFWDCFHNPLKTPKCLRKRHDSFFS